MRKCRVYDLNKQVNGDGISPDEILSEGLMQWARTFDTPHLIMQLMRLKASNIDFTSSIDQNLHVRRLRLDAKSLFYSNFLQM